MEHQPAKLFFLTWTEVLEAELLIGRVEHTLCLIQRTLQGTLHDVYSVGGARGAARLAQRVQNRSISFRSRRHAVPEDIYSALGEKILGEKCV